MTQMPSPVASSSITLLNLVSLCVMRSGRSASSRTPVMDLRARAKSISGLASAARPCSVGGDGLLQRGEAFRRVVKIGDGVVQARRGQVGKQLLEAPEGLRRLERLLGRLDGVVGARVLDEAIGAPGFSLRIHVPVAPVARRNQRERAARAVGLAGHLRGKMRRDALDVLHQRGGIVEDVVIDALQDVARGRAAAWQVTQVGVVDVAVAVGRESEELAAELELAAPRRERRRVFRLMTRAFRILAGGDERGECFRRRAGGLRDR